MNDEDTTSLSQLTKSNFNSLQTISNLSTSQISETLKPDDSNDHQSMNRSIDENCNLNGKVSNFSCKNTENLDQNNGDANLNQNSLLKPMDSDRLITMNLEDENTDENQSDDKMKANQQLHLNTMSDISMLTFPEVDENVDTYKQHASSRCLLNCSPNKCSSKNHNDLLIDETNTYNDVNLFKDFSNASTAQVRFDGQLANGFGDEDDHLDIRYIYPTLKSGDHSSELDSDLDAEFDNEEDELILLQEEQDADLISQDLLSDVYNQENVDENDENDYFEPRILDLNKLAQDDNYLKIGKTNLDDFVSSKHSI